MTLAIGSRLGPYEVLAAIGRGGMGEVYRAKDTRLGRDVALKILPGTFAYDQERLARFAREAQLLATLAHPHIGAIYGLEEAGDSKALVLELVEGPTLADRIAQGPIPVDEALQVARQIAEALEAAHAAGIVHRDLKPANIKLRDDGTVKVLDFGLAKAIDSGPASSSSLSFSPTITSPAMTAAGLIMGTAAYMSPEQAKGKAVDRRADVWAFGAVLFEMLTGRRAFAGEEVSEVLASVLAREPQLATVPESVPGRVRQVLKACLQKDPRQRLHDMADVRLALDGAFDVPPATTTLPAASPRWSWWKAAAVAASVLAAAAIGGLAAWRVKPDPPGAVGRFVHSLGEESFSRTGRPIVALSRDASRFAYIAGSQIYLRNRADPVARPIPGTNVNPSSPVFSSDGDWIAFWVSTGATGEIRKIQTVGGTAVPLIRAANPLGMSWSQDGRIVYAQQDGIWRVSDNGGAAAEQIVKAMAGERMHAPQMLPGQEAVLFTVTTKEGTAGWDEGSIVVQSLQTGERTVVGRGAYPRYLTSGHLVFASGGTLFAMPFDLNARKPRGGQGPVPVITGIQRAIGATTGIAQYSVSDNGAIVYVSGVAESEMELALVDGPGTPHILPGSKGPLSFPRFSHDGSRIAVERGDGEDANIWIYNVRNAQWRQLTSQGGQRPQWTLDDAAITFLKGEELWQVPADFSGTAQPLPGSRVRGNDGPYSWSRGPSGEVLLYGSPAGFHIYSPTRKPAAKNADPPEVAFPTPEQTGRLQMASFSRDGRLVAYAFGSGGAPNVYVSPFPFRAGGQQKVINETSFAPVWDPNGERLYAVSGQSLQVLEVSNTPNPTFSNPKALFSIQTFAGMARLGFRNYDVTRTHQFVVTIPAGMRADSRPEIQIVLDWFDELNRLAPTDPR